MIPFLIEAENVLSRYLHLLQIKTDSETQLEYLAITVTQAISPKGSFDDNTDEIRSKQSMVFGKTNVRNSKQNLNTGSQSQIQT